MFLLILFAFIAGIVTILSPCILPVLPIILSGTIGGSKSRPLGIVLGFIVSFTFFTLFLTTLVKLTNVSADLLRLISVLVVFLFGLSLLIPQFQILSEKLFSKLSNLVPTKNTSQGFIGGVILGLSLGLVWTPCVGPIIASVIALAATSQITLNAVFITFSYALGTAVPMLIFIYGGQRLLQNNTWLLSNSGKIQRIFGVLMILTAIGIFFNLDRKFQTYILEVFPQYGVGLTKFEENSLIKEQLNSISKTGNNWTSEVQSLSSPPAPELIAGGEWFNTEPFTIESQKGKVVLVDFWTYTCINCIRTLPYLKDWYDKYKDKGLVIVGVHTPEFEFEKNPTNVQKAINDFGIKYPVMQDNNYATWTAYNNYYWPSKYLIDANGKVRYYHFGEGGYDQTEQMIQQLLEEAGQDVGTTQINNQQYTINTQTPETYLGYFRGNPNFGSPQGIIKDQLTTYTLPSRLEDNDYAFNGGWMVASQYANAQAGSSLLLNFEAKDVFLVMRPKGEEVGKVEVYLDNVKVTSLNVGEDVKNGVVTVDKDRLYKLINLVLPSRHVLELRFLDSNTEAFAFTFG